jgi:curved DNA-binding protein CbpA
MSDPYEVLGVGPTAEENEIRQRYLQLVRENPPDVAPERFARIRAAYDELRNPYRRLERMLFYLDTEDSLAAIRSELHARLKDVKLSMAQVLSLADAR